MAMKKPILCVLLSLSCLPLFAQNALIEPLMSYLNRLLKKASFRVSFVHWNPPGP
jgi:hypothetical protein